MRLALLICVASAVACSGPVSVAPSPAAHSSPRPVAVASGGIVEYRVPDPSAPPAGCGTPCRPSLGSAARGPDGNIWYVDVGRRVVGRITPAGQFAQFDMPEDLAGGAQTIAAGPDHNMWVLARTGIGIQPDWILRVSVTGDVAKFPAGKPASPVRVDSIAAGPDGNLWFTDVSSNGIGMLTPAGTVTEFPTLTPGSAPRGIVAGPDGNLWFTESDRNHTAIARITPHGVVTEYRVSQGPSDNAPQALISGPDGNLWFTEIGGLGHISTAGEILQVALPQDVQPRGLVSGPDGNIWFTDSRTNSIARIGIAGAIREFRLPRRASDPLGMAVGADGRIWFTLTGGWLASIGTKVPEALLSPGVLPFIDSTPKSVTVRNTGDAALSISSVRIGGIDRAVFNIQEETCAGRTLNPGAACEVRVDRGSGGPPGVLSALLEIADNASGSPQRVSLVSQLGTCRLPVVVSAPNSPPQGGLIDMTTGNALYDPRGQFEIGSDASGRFRTTAQPALTGQTAAYFDRSAGRWLPVSNAAEISPDGSRYAYASFDPSTRNHIHLVDIATGVDRVIPMDPGFWGVLAFTEQGIYLVQRNEGVGPGLWLINPDTGVVRQVLTSEVVDTVRGSTAWIDVWDPRDTAPQPPGEGGSHNEVLKRDLATGKTTTWFYRSGANVGVVGLAGDGAVISVYDGATLQLFWVATPGAARPMDFPFTTGSYPAFNGFVADEMGIWVGSEDGVYVWNARTGGVLVSTEAATPAGTCA